MKPKIHQYKRRGQTRNFYDRCNNQNRYRLNSGDRRIQFSGRIQYGQNYRGRKAIGMTLGEEILEVMQEHIKVRISEDRIIEVDIEEIIEMIIMKEVGVGLEKGHIQVLLEEMTGVVVTVDEGQDQELVLIERELGVIHVENMIISQKIVQQWLEKKERQNKYSRCLI